MLSRVRARFFSTSTIPAGQTKPFSQTYGGAFLFLSLESLGIAAFRVYLENMNQPANANQHSATNHNQAGTAKTMR